MAVREAVDGTMRVEAGVPGVQPGPEALLYGLMQLQRKIDRMTIARRKAS